MTTDNELLATLRWLYLNDPKLWSQKVDSTGTTSAALRRVMDELIESAIPIRVSMSKRPARKVELTGDCSVDCTEQCQYPGQFSECS